MIDSRRALVQQMYRRLAHRRGAILVWDEPHRVLVEWRLASGADLERLGASELEVSFTPHLKDATLVCLEHRHIQRTASVDRIVAMLSPYGWDLLVYNFQAFLEREPWPAAVRRLMQQEGRGHG